MRLQGTCTECGKHAWVRVPGGNLWKIQLGKIEGVCSECEMKRR